jgi:hypothetical protein
VDRQLTQDNCSIPDAENTTPSGLKVRKADIAVVLENIDLRVEKLSQKHRKGWNSKVRHYYRSLDGNLLREWLLREGLEELANYPPFIAYCLALTDSVDYCFRQNEEHSPYLNASLRFQQHVSVKLVASKLLHSAQQPFSKDDYDKHSDVRQLLATLYTNLRPILTDLGWLQIKEYRATEECRRYDISGMMQARSDSLRHRAHRSRNATSVENYWVEDTIEPDRSQPASKDRDIFHKRSKRHPASIAFADKVRTTPFRFAAERWKRQGALDVATVVQLRSKVPELKRELANLLKNPEAKPDEIRKLKYKIRKAEYADHAREITIQRALDALDLSTTEPQFNGQLHIQGPGRLFTHGGPMALPKPIRLLYLHPAQEGRVFVDVDLVSAQLRIAMQLLGLNDLLQQVQELHRQGGDIYESIAQQTALPRDIKKVLVLGSLMCKGAAAVAAFTNNEVNKQGLDCTVGVHQVQEILDHDPILSPIIRKRDEWIEPYTIDALLSTGRAARKVPAILPERPLGDGTLFHLKKRAREYVEYVEARNQVLRASGEEEININQYHVGLCAFAFLLQGEESRIMSEVGSRFSLPIAVSMYDGFMFECGPDEVSARIEELEALLHEVSPTSDFKFDVLWFPCHPEIEEMDVLELVVNGDYKQFGDPRSSADSEAFAELMGLDPGDTVGLGGLDNYLLYPS